MNTLKILLSIACINSWEIEQMDVQTAFLNGSIKSEVYIYAPDGCKIKNGKVCLLNKSLYGLRESPRDWYECFHNFMISINFERSNYDNCLYISAKNESQTYVILYVDDLLIFGSNIDTIEEIKTKLSKRFKMKDLGRVKQYLGIEMQYNQKEKKLHLSQEKYIESLAEKYGVTQSKRYDTPMEINLKLEASKEIKKENEDLKYRNIIGALLYIANGTKPDVSFSVNYLSRYQTCYDSTHFKYALRVLKYLYSTKSLKLVYDSEYREVIDAYVDADWASDIVDRKSTTGILLRVYGNVVFWKSQKQKIVSRASTHAEYYALAECVQETLPIRRILTELGINLTNAVKIYEDNTGAISLGKNRNFSKNSKHIDVSYHFVNDYQRKGLISIEKVSTDDQIADVLTKSLSRVKFCKFRNTMGLNN